MPTTRKPKRPHPRSLDALFPKPKVRRCGRGHGQTPEWRPSRGCSTCRKQDDERALDEQLRQYAGAAEREKWRAILPPLPDPYVLRCTDGTRPQVFRACGRRGPARRKRIKLRA